MSRKDPWRPGLDLLVQHLPLGVFVTDGRGEPVYLSERCAEMTGTEADPPGSRNWVGRVHDEDRDRVLAAWDASLNGTPFDETYRVQHDAGDVRWVHVRADPMLRDRATGPRRVEALIGTVEDTTELVDLQRRGGDRQVMLDAVLSNSSDVVVVIDEAARLTFLNDAMYRVLGHRPAEWIGREVYELLHPDDVGHTITELAASMERGETAMSPVVVRVRDAEGRWRHVEVIANSMEGSRSVAGVVITARDISERLRAEASADEARDRFEQAFDRAPIGMALIANDGHLLRANEALAAMVGRTVPELTDESLFHLVHPDDRAEALDRALAVLSRSDNDPIEVRFVCGDGRTAWARVTSTVIHDEDGLPQHTIAHIEDVTEQRTVREQLERAAAHDPLTGLLNRAGFANRVAEAAHSGPARSAALLIIDLDGFKNVNDSHGHAAGDELLVLIARRLVDSVRITDLVARLGGDEFAIYQPDAADAAVVVALGERVRATLATPFELRAGTVHISGSVGVALLDGAVTLSRALATADAASYAAKRSGGDRLELTWCTELGLAPTES
jgi:diguanylate cyclase (GGDEF)-like protein/PAS domain S-box-containing protein